MSSLQSVYSPIDTYTQTSIVPRLPASSPTLFEAKKIKNLSFETIAKALGREEVAVAALFYGQAKASPEDIKNLAQVLELDESLLESQLSGYPDRGRDHPKLRLCLQSCSQREVW